MTGWGKALAGSSSTELPGGLSFTSETVTGVLGVDVERNDLLLAFALSQGAERGGAGFAASGDENGLDGSLSLVTPYARLRADLAMQVVAAGARADLLRPDPEASGLALALKTDAFFVRTESENVSRHGVGTGEPEALLRGLGLIRGGIVFRAAAVLLGSTERLECDMPQCLLRVTRCRGLDRSEFLDNRQFNGNAFTLLASAERCLRETLPIASRFEASRIALGRAALPAVGGTIQSRFVPTGQIRLTR